MMDLNPDTRQAAAKAITDWLKAFPVGKDSGYVGWGATPEELVEAAYPIIAEAVARATADAIADQILTLRPSDHLSDAARVGYDLAVRHAAGDARSFGSTAPEGPKP